MVVLAGMHIMDLLVALVAAVDPMELQVVAVDIQVVAAAALGLIIQIMAVTNTQVVAVDPTSQVVILNG